jgi:hypothetical protein
MNPSDNPLFNESISWLLFPVPLRRTYEQEVLTAVAPRTLKRAAVRNAFAQNARLLSGRSSHYGFCARLTVGDAYLLQQSVK